jgi:glycosyltransferase involved in cell wall biosynthesis
MPINRLRVSLVIPVYNEESYLRACLESALKQTIPFDEIIVVDNNSTDTTVAIASQFPAVTILREARQGVVYARNCGFDAAKGDVIARCDGDTIFDADWVERIQAIFVDASVDAVSGQVVYRGVGLAPVFTAIDGQIRRYLAKRMSVANEMFLYGVNMAIRREAWRSVRGHICYDRELHEDLDLAAHLAALKCKVIFVPELHVSISPRQAAATPSEFYTYAWSNTLVYKKHHLSMLRSIRLMALFITCLYPVIFVLYRGYNPALGRFSLWYLLTNTKPARVSPVSAVLPSGK